MTKTLRAGESMQVILVRHATRDTRVVGDAGLNSRGQEQAKEFVARLQPEGSLPRPTALLSSPKRRARETLQPMSLACKVSVEVDHDLDERNDGETLPQFVTRLRTWLATLETRFQARDAIYICTHLDWLNEALILIPSDLNDHEVDRPFEPAEFLHFEIREGVWREVSRS